MADPKGVWDKAVQDALQRQQESTTTSPARGRCKRLELGREPRPHYFPSLDRDLAKIHARIREKIRWCIAGELPWPLVLWGPAGTGKTCAALCLSDYAGGFYYTAQGLCEEMILAMKGQLFTPETRRTVSQHQLWEELGQSALVILDEVGARNTVSDHAYDCVKKLLDQREGMPLVVISNLSLARLEHLYDDRVCSRLVAGTVLEVRGDDMRMAR